MTPIHEMKTRKATWRDRHDAPCHGVFFEVDGREVGVVIRDQPEAVTKPLIEAIAALPEVVSALLSRGHWSGAIQSGSWHTTRCHESDIDVCTEDCHISRCALVSLGVLP